MMVLLQRVWEWFNDRTGTSTLIGPVLAHPVPRGAKWSYVFGSATLFAFLVQVVTGIALATAYVTSTGDAYDSLQFITHDPFGYVLRGMHFYGASAMIVMVGLHMIQVFLIGAYKFPREMNWLTGVVLLGVTVAMGFTGQLLRWDDIAVWSIFVAASQASRMPVIGDSAARFIIAGDQIGGATLSRFYAFHVFFIPALIFAVVGLHVWPVLHHGVSEPPQAERPVDPKSYRAWYHAYLERDGVPFWPDGAWRDVVVGVGMVIAIMLLGLRFGAPALFRAARSQQHRRLPTAGLVYALDLLGVRAAAGGHRGLCDHHSPTDYRGHPYGPALCRRSRRAQPAAPAMGGRNRDHGRADDRHTLAGRRASALVAQFQRAGAATRCRGRDKHPGPTGSTALPCEGLPVLPCIRRAGRAPRPRSHPGRRSADDRADRDFDSQRPDEHAGLCRHAQADGSQ
jgi:hypothetical protein